MAFPSNPSLNELYPTTVDPGERQWIWNGYAWDTVSGASGVYVGTTELQFNNSPTPQHLTGILSIDGLAASATALATARTINGTAFNGTANITTANWGTGRTLTIGATGKSVNGSANVSWSLAEIGAVQPDQLATVATTGSYNDLADIPANITSVEYGVYVLHDTAVPLGGYPAARSASLTGPIRRLYVETDDTVELQVTVGGSGVYYGTLAAGTHSLALTAAVAAQDEVTFYFSAGTPTSVWAQIDGGSP